MPSVQLEMASTQLGFSWTEPGEVFVGRAEEAASIEAAWRGRRGLIAIEGGLGAGKSAFARAVERRLRAQGLLQGALHVRGVLSDRRGAAGRLLEELAGALGTSIEGLAAKEAADRLTARLVETPALLVLDQVERVQHPPHLRGGRVRHAGLSQLLSALSDQADARSLVLVFSRQRLAEGARASRLTLAGLSPEEGGALLGALGLDGEARERAEASVALEGSPLALRQWARRLEARGAARAACWDRVDAAELIETAAQPSIDLEARRVAAALATDLASVERLPRRAAGRGRPEATLLALASLTPGGLDEAALAALLAEPAIPGLTDALLATSAKARAARLDVAIRRLRARGLLAPVVADGSRPLVSPLLVRAAVRERLRVTAPAALGVAERRLFQHVKAGAPSHPRTAGAMTPLLRALPHGVAGAEKSGAMSKLFRAQFWDRALRGESRFAVARLGLFADTLAALRGFFVEPWTRPDPRLESLDQARALSLAGFMLHGRTRLREAAAAQAHAADAYRRLGRLEDAARAETERAEALLLLGEGSAARDAASLALSLSETLSPWSDRRVVALSAAAGAALLCGEPAAAGQRLREAERIQARRMAEGLSERGRLYSLAGRRAVSALLRAGRLNEARSRAGGLASVAAEDGLPFARGLALLTQGEVASATLEEDPRRAIPEARAAFDGALEAFENAGRLDALPEALLARGGFAASLAARRGGAGDRAAALQDLQRSLELATAAGMAPIAEAAERGLREIEDDVPMRRVEAARRAEPGRRS